MDAHSLTDEKIYPDDEVLARALGRTKIAWDAMGEMLKNDHPAAAAEWRYYHDGKCWLCKVTEKKKTLCWISVYKGYFKTTGYFGDKAEGAIMESALSDAIKKEWLSRDKIGKLRPITLAVRKRADLKSVQSLLDVKSRVK